MVDPGRSLRKAALVFLATACTGCGLFLIFRLMPDRVGVVATSTLLGLLGLLVLPGVTLAALELDRRAVSRGRPGDQDAADGHRREAHEPGERPESGGRHRRRVGSSAAVD